MAAVEDRKCFCLISHCCSWCWGFSSHNWVLPVILFTFISNDDLISRIRGCDILKALCLWVSMCVMVMWGLRAPPCGASSAQHFAPLLSIETLSSTICTLFPNSRLFFFAYCGFLPYFIFRFYFHLFIYFQCHFQSFVIRLIWLFETSTGN